MRSRILLMGVTGGLGVKILEELLQKHSVSPGDIIATSRSQKNRSRFESQGVQSRVADYDDCDSLVKAFDNVHDLLFMSSSERDTLICNVQHANVVRAAKQAEVGRAWYVSLAYGGCEDTSTIMIQQAHYETENMLRDQGRKKNIIWLTGPKAESLIDLVEAINRARDTQTAMKHLEPQAWIDACSQSDVEYKSHAWFEARLDFTNGVSAVDAKLVDPALEIILGRRPVTDTSPAPRL